MDQLAAISMFLFQLCGSSAIDYAKDVAHAAKKYNLDSRVLVSMMRQESHCDQNATGALGEIGLFQLKRNTWATSGYNKLTDKQLRKPRINIMLGARHLYRCLQKCDGWIAGALGMYSGLRKSKKTGLCRENKKYGGAILARIAES
jgi:soluble lytic murein transglycosylase-like protein